MGHTSEDLPTNRKIILNWMSTNSRMKSRKSFFFFLSLFSFLSFNFSVSCNAYQIGQSDLVLLPLSLFLSIFFKLFYRVIVVLRRLLLLLLLLRSHLFHFVCFL